MYSDLQGTQTLIAMGWESTKKMVTEEKDSRVFIKHFLPFKFCAFSELCQFCQCPSCHLTALAWNLVYTHFVERKQIQIDPESIKCKCKCRESTKANISLTPCICTAGPFSRHKKHVSTASHQTCYSNVRVEANFISLLFLLLCTKSGTGQFCAPNR